MILTGKCKEKFFEIVNHNEFTFSLLNDLHQNALIIEFFDSVGVIVNVKRYVMPLGEIEWYFIITSENGAHLNNHVSEESRSVLDCRKNITEQAIKKANDIYNAKTS